MNKNDYVKFIIYNWKTKKCETYTCNPKFLGNYFTQSDFPYETSLVCFNTDVFSKYKMKDEYNVTNYNIKFKNKWKLGYYLSKDNSQVFVLLRDLSLIPYEEQLYLKAFNEKITSNISEKMKKNYFNGEFVEPYKLDLLKNLLENFPRCIINKEEYCLWEKHKYLKEPHNLENLNYLKIASKLEWESELKTLYFIIIEGLNIKTIQLIAEKLNCLNCELKSIKQLNECLNKQNISDKHINQIIIPLTKLNTQRSKINAHLSEENYPDDLIKDFNQLVNDCYDGFKCLSEVIKKGYFNFE